MKATPSAPDVPEATDTWLAKISMRASAMGWWVLASLMCTFKVTSGNRKSTLTLTGGPKGYMPRTSRTEFFHIILARVMFFLIIKLKQNFIF